MDYTTVNLSEMTPLQTMQSVWRFALLLAASALAFGCGSSGPTSSYDASDNQTLYRTGKMAVAQLSSGYGSSSTITMQAIAQCSGPNCTPESVDFLFSVEGNSETGLTTRTLSVTADGEDYRFEEQRSPRTRAGDIERSQNTTVRVSGVPLSDVKTVAMAESVDGTLGGIALNLESSQSDLRALVSMMEGTGGT